MSKEDIIEKYQTYSDYLSSQLTSTDLEYLEDEEMGRHLVELGYRGSGEVVRREDFEERKKIYLEKANRQASDEKQLASSGIDLSHSPFLQALAAREELIRAGKLATIVFLRDYNSKGQEISGYIDLTQRMKTDDFVSIFNSSQKLLPKPSDLSYYNYDTKLSTSNSTLQYQVIADSSQGLLFKNKRDRRIINVNPLMNNNCNNNATSATTTMAESNSSYGNGNGENTTRIEIESSKDYTQIVLYDHSTRKKM